MPRKFSSGPPTPADCNSVVRHIRQVSGFTVVCGLDFEGRHYSIVLGVAREDTLEVPVDGWPGAARRVLYTDKRPLVSLLYSALLDYAVVIDDECARRAAAAVWEAAGEDLPF